jgi:Acetyltransferases, including N-acetylases of ribosomal proteins
MGFYKKIIGNRLYLSPFDIDDSEIHAKWAEWMNDKSTADNYGGFHNIVSLTEAKKTVEKLSGYRFAIVLLENDTLIGHISLHDVDHLNRNAFMGIVIGEKEYRNKGYGTEAVRLAVDFGFNALNLHNIILSVHSDNQAGINCYKKVGFKEVGRRRDWIYKNGKYTDLLYMDILESEFIQ